MTDEQVVTEVSVNNLGDLIDIIVEGVQSTDSDVIIIDATEMSENSDTPEE